MTETGHLQRLPRPAARRCGAGLAVLALAGLVGFGFSGTETASANACAAACYAQHNQCRMSTKGSPSCDAALTQCLRSCPKR